MSNDTFAANQTEINRLRTQVKNNDAARTARHKVLRKIDAAERQAMQSIAQAAMASEGTASARRLQSVPVVRLVGSKLEHSSFEPVPFAQNATQNATHRAPLANTRRVQAATATQPTSTAATAATNHHHAAKGWRAGHTAKPSASATATPQPPRPPQDTLSERIKADIAAASQRDRKSAAWIVAIYLLAIVATVALTQMPTP